MRGRRFFPLLLGAVIICGAGVLSADGSSAQSRESAPPELAPRLKGRRVDRLEAADQTPAPQPHRRAAGSGRDLDRLALRLRERGQVARERLGSAAVDLDEPRRLVVILHADEPGRVAEERAGVVGPSSARATGSVVRTYSIAYRAITVSRRSGGHAPGSSRGAAAGSKAGMRSPRAKRTRSSGARSWSCSK